MAAREEKISGEPLPRARTVIAAMAAALGCLVCKMYAAKRETAAAIFIQKYVRMCLPRHVYMKLNSSVVIIQSNVRGFTSRRRFLHIKEHKAATSIQAHWRLCKVRSTFQKCQGSIVAIQCLWQCRQAKCELRRLKQEANEAGALRLAKSKLEKQLEELTWRLQLEKKKRASSEEAKQVEISKLQKMLEGLHLELDTAKLATINESNKNAVLQNQLQLSVKEKFALERELVVMDEVQKENALLKVTLQLLKLLRVVLSTPANRSYFIAQNLLPPIIPMLSAALENYIKIAASLGVPSNSSLPSNKATVENFESISAILNNFLWTATAIFGHISSEERQLQMRDGLLELLISYQVIHRLKDLFAVHDRPQMEGSAFPAPILLSIHLLVVLTSRPGTMSYIDWETSPLVMEQEIGSEGTKFADHVHSVVNTSWGDHSPLSVINGSSKN